MSDNPFAPPQAPLETPQVSAITPQVGQVAERQRYLLIAFLCGILANLFPPALFLSIPAQIFCLFRLAKALEISTAMTVLFCVLQVIPLLNFLILLHVNSQATKLLQAAGLKVGLMGVSAKQLAGR